METSVNEEKYLNTQCRECKTGIVEAWRDTTPDDPFFTRKPKIVSNPTRNEPKPSRTNDSKKSKNKKSNKRKFRK
jgi:hypothetical protein